MGHPEVALLFFDNASRLKPDNLAFPSLALECLKTVADWPNALVCAEQYRQTPRNSSLAARSRVATFTIFAPTILVRGKTTRRRSKLSIEDWSCWQAELRRNQFSQSLPVLMQRKVCLFNTSIVATRL